jgi:hypothetical protein
LIDARAVPPLYSNQVLYCTFREKKEKEKLRRISQAAAQPQPHAQLPPGNARDLVSFSITLILEKETGAIGWRKRGESGSYDTISTLIACRLTTTRRWIAVQTLAHQTNFFSWGWKNCPTQRPESFLPLAELGVRSGAHSVSALSITEHMVIIANVNSRVKGQSMCYATRDVRERHVQAGPKSSLSIFLMGLLHY